MPGGAGTGFRPAEPDEHRPAGRVAHVAHRPVAAPAPTVGQVMAADRLGIAGEAARQFGSVAGHHETSRALTLCCVEAVDRLRDSAQSRGRNITPGATYSTLCATAHKVDAATGEHGDLLDVIRESCGLVDFRDVADEARRFLACRAPIPTRRPQARREPVPRRICRRPHDACSPCRSRSPARSLNAISQPRHSRSRPASARCASIRAATTAISRPARPDDAGADRGRHRSRRADHGRPAHLARPDGATARRKLPIRAARWAIFSATPSGLASIRPTRRVMAAGEGLETVLTQHGDTGAAGGRRDLGQSPREPDFRPAAVASTSPADADAAGRHGIERLSRGAGEAGIVALCCGRSSATSTTICGTLGPDRLGRRSREQLVPEDARRPSAAG